MGRIHARRGGGWALSEAKGKVTGMRTLDLLKSGV